MRDEVFSIFVRDELFCIQCTLQLTFILFFFFYREIKAQPIYGKIPKVQNPYPVDIFTHRCSVTVIGFGKE